MQLIIKVFLIGFGIYNENIFTSKIYENFEIIFIFHLLALVI